MTGPVQIRSLDLRRAVLSILLHRGRPVSLQDIMLELEDVQLETEHSETAAQPETIAGRLSVSARQRVSDLLRWQISNGHVRRISLGVYMVVPDSMSRTTIWRCHNWRRLRRVRNQLLEDQAIDDQAIDGQPVPLGS